MFGIFMFGIVKYSLTITHLHSFSTRYQIGNDIDVNLINITIPNSTAFYRM